MKIYVDGHSDTLKKAYDDGKDLFYSGYDFNLNDMNLNIPRIQNLSAFVHPDFKDGFKRAKDIIGYYDLVKDGTVLIKNIDDLDFVLKNKKMGVILSLENGRGIGESIENVDFFYEKGVRIMGLTWNEDNLIGSGALTQKDKGLTPFGIEYIKKLEEKNILIDVSHASEKTFWDTVKNSSKTIVATHSCVFDLCNHPRNLKDNQIKEIARRGGVIGICFANKFLNLNSENASIFNVIENIEYIINLVGEDFVGLGSDFDGLGEEYKTEGVSNVKDIVNIEKELIKKGYSQKNIDKIMGENWIRVLKSNL